VATIATVPEVFAEEQDSPYSEVKSLKLFNIHTREALDVEFCRDGVYDETILHELNHFLRDHRTGESIAMDHALYDQMWEIQSRCGGDGVFYITSGYRSPTTNNKLLKNSSRVAKQSYHVKGQAIDLHLRGTKLSVLRREALALRAGGVGYYPGANFVALTLCILTQAPYVVGHKGLVITEL